EALLGEALFRLLGIIRVYTKEVGEAPSKVPLVLREGATVEDLAKMIHSDFLKNFKYARLWGPSAKFPGERVGLNRSLQDGDIVEIHT
ncbi:TGS domain-containing protein, partial [Candidatus Bathyarchaeota archaeon]|nr:TGS domain-containing protein [Candidatus Bathyarchaeota archaeon]